MDGCPLGLGLVVEDISTKFSYTYMSVTALVSAINVCSTALYVCMLLAWGN